MKVSGGEKTKTTKRSEAITSNSRAFQFPTIPILPQGRSIGGILERSEAVGGGLLGVSVSGREYLVDESLQESLAGLLGQQVAICRVCGKWGGGRMPA
ncbi:MAG: hypothetical protein NTU95_05530 [Methanothrix sp.]|nr:hypothetical protein [Methanothrix sp.]